MRSRREEPLQAETKEREWTTIKVVCLGLRERRTGLSAKSYTLEFLKLGPDENITPTSESMAYEDKSPGTSHSIAKTFIVGGIYNMEVSDGSARVQASKFQHLYRYESTRAEWLALDRATRGALEVERLEKGLAKHRTDLECLDPLRAAYERMTPRQRAAYLARIVQYMMTGN